MVIFDDFCSIFGHYEANLMKIPLNLPSIAQDTCGCGTEIQFLCYKEDQVVLEGHCMRCDVHYKVGLHDQNNVAAKKTAMQLMVQSLRARYKVRKGE